MYTEILLVAFILELLVLIITYLNELSHGEKSKYLRWQWSPSWIKS